jgi:hypothetical protein
MSAIADKVMNSCCADKLDNICNKLPFKKHNNDNHNNDAGDVDVTPTAEATTPTTAAASASAAAVSAAKPSKKKPSTTSGVVTPLDMKYELTQWKDLPANVQKVAKDVLGYDEAMWNDSEWVEVDDKHWWDLEDEELEAVKLFGWDEDSWESKYEDWEWSELPAAAKKAAEAAGYTEELWEEGEHPAEEKWWEDMTEQEIVALSVLGWTQYKWDD